MSDNDIKSMTEQLHFVTNAADARGGGPLWAVDGIACVAHGRSTYQEISRAIGQAKLAVERDLVGALKAELEYVRNRINAQVELQ